MIFYYYCFWSTLKKEGIYRADCKALSLTFFQLFNCFANRGKIYLFKQRAKNRVVAATSTAVLLLRPNVIDCHKCLIKDFIMFALRMECQIRKNAVSPILIDIFFNRMTVCNFSMDTFAHKIAVFWI